MAKVSFEKKIESANALLNELMRNDISLDESLKAYERGVKELNDAQRMLEEATLHVEGLKNPNPVQMQG